MLKKYTTLAYTTRILILLSDIFLCAVSLCLATFLRFNFEIEESLMVLGKIILPVLFVRVIGFRFFHTYAVIVRYAGTIDLKKVFLSLSFSSGVLIMFCLFLRPFSGETGGLSFLNTVYGFFLPLSIIIIDYFLCLVFLSATRLLMPVLFAALFYERKFKKNIVIFGGGELGALTSNMIRQEDKSNIVAIFDDNPDIQKKFLNGIPVYNPSDLNEIVDKYDVQDAIIAIQNIPNKRKSEFYESCLDNGVKVLQVPPYESWIDAELKLDQIKELRIEDLLNRPAIQLANKPIRNVLNGKVIMITGSAGSIGSELVRQIAYYKPQKLIVLDQAESPLVNLDLEIREKLKFENIVPVIADVRDRVRLDQIFNRYKPELVFHAAAYKHVPIMEAYPREAVSVNVAGTKNVADLADKYGTAKFVMVSTDKAVNPTNVMGASKRVAEMYIQSKDKDSSTQYITTRFGNVLGSNGSVVPRFRRQIEQGGPVTVTHKDITRYFMTIPEASQLVLEAGVMGNGGEIFLFDMGEPVRILDLAEKIIALAGLKPYEDIDIEFTGLRPGEKLTEELLTHSENSIPTHHSKITKARKQEFDYEETHQKISQLIDLIKQDDEKSIVLMMKQLVPEYISNNSRFGEMDKQEKLN